MRFVQYALATGAILAVCEAQEEFLSSFESTGVGVLEYSGNAGESTHYVSGGAVVARPTISPVLSADTIQADGVAAATITGIPTGWAYSISNGATGTTDGSDIVFTAAEPAIYDILFTKWPYQSVRLSINATATY